MKASLTLAFALLLICTGTALASTPDGTPPSGETVCDGEVGAAYGLCTAYCEAMDCESDDPHASETACTKVGTKFLNITGRAVPCEVPAVACPCTDAARFEASTGFNTVLNGQANLCSDEEGNVAILTNDGEARAVSTLAGSPLGDFCSFTSPEAIDSILSITPEEGSVCVQLVREACLPE